jgi:ribosome-binding factor A
MLPPSKLSAHGLSRRQLQVGEEVRQALAGILGDYVAPKGEHLSLTISEVRMSPDLKNAKVFFLALGQYACPKSLMPALEASMPDIRKALAAKCRLRFLPQLRFVPDTSLDHAAAIDKLLQSRTPKD